MILPSEASSKQGVLSLRQEILDAFESALSSPDALRTLDELAQASNLDEKEESLVRLRAQIFPAVMAPVFRETGYSGSRRSCGCGGRQRFVRYDEKGFLTRVGEVRIRRARYHCPRCGVVEKPLDEEWALPSGHYSLGLQRVSSLLGASMPFAMAGRTLEELAGVGMSARQIEDLTEDVGARIDEDLTREASCFAKGDVEVEPECDVLVVAVDGGMINTREKGWREVKLGAVQSLFREDEETLSGRYTSYTAHLGSVDRFRELLWGEVSRRGEKGRESTVVLGDGAPWIWNVADEIMPGAVQVLDWYHLSEHVHETKRLVFEGREKSGERWARRLEDRLWCGRIAEALRGIRMTRAPDEVQQNALRDLSRYIETNRRRMAYQSLEAKGYPVGSGIVESGIKQVVHQRHKQAGMRWNPSHAQKMLNVSAYLRGARWVEFWASRARAA